MNGVPHLLSIDPKQKEVVTFSEEDWDQIWVIPDIHGCVETFEKVYRALQLGEKDLLILLGDYINKGPQSRKVLDLILEIKKNNLHGLLPLRGNHEEMALMAHESLSQQSDSSVPEYKLPRLGKTKQILNADGKISEEYHTFISTLPYCLRSENHIFVHAGLNPRDPFGDLKAMLWDNKQQRPSIITETIIHGHDLRDREHICKSVLRKNNVIGLDNGCCYRNRPTYGHLSALEIKSRILLFERNIDKPIVEKVV